MRHATAESNHGSDHNRCLSPKGKKEAYSIGVQLAELDNPNFRIFCSDALRTRQTCEELLKSKLTDEEVGFESVFYLGSVDQVIETVWALDDKYSSLLLIGHNPTWSQMATMLSNTMVGLQSGHTVLLEKESAKWSAALASPGWDLIKTFIP